MVVMSFAKKLQTSTGRNESQDPKRARVETHLRIPDKQCRTGIYQDLRRAWVETHLRIPDYKRIKFHTTKHLAVKGLKSSPNYVFESLHKHITFRLCNNNIIFHGPSLDI